MAKVQRARSEHRLHLRHTPEGEGISAISLLGNGLRGHKLSAEPAVFRSQPSCRYFSAAAVGYPQIPVTQKGTSMPSVDVVIPCYQYGRFLRECVSSVLMQENVDVRCLIIDDASNDDSASLAKDLALEDSRVAVVVHPTNRGNIATYNEGIEWASAKYFLLLSADDLIAPGCLERAVSIMEENPRITMTHGKEMNLYGDQGAPKLPAKDFDRQWVVRPGIELIRELCETTKNRIGTSTVVVRTEAQKAVGGYRSELPHAGDLEMWLRLASLGDVAETPLIQGIRRVHGANMSVAQFGTAIANFKQLNAAFASFFQNEGCKVKNYLALWSLSRTRLAERIFWQGLKELRTTELRQALQMASLALLDRPSIILPTPRKLRKLSRFLSATWRERM